MRMFLIVGIAIVVSGCASLLAESNKTKNSTPAPFQGSAVTMRPKVELIEPGPVATAISADKLFAIDPKDRALSDTLGRWALQNNLSLGWLAGYDYPITPAMRGISAPNFNSALTSIRTALRNVTRPLLISVSGQNLFVRPGEARQFSGPQIVAMTNAAKRAEATQDAESTVANNQPKNSESVADLVVSHGKRNAESSKNANAENQNDASPWAVNPADALLSASLTRWAGVAKVKISWVADIDFPVTVKKPRIYAGSLSEAVGAVLKDVSKNGASLTHVLIGNELIIKESGN